MPQVSRNAVIAGGVVLFHVAALWALQSGLVRRAVEAIVPVEILSEIITPPVPVVEPLPTPKPPDPIQQPVKLKAPVPPPAPQLQASPNLPPAPNAPVGIVEAPPPPPIAAPVAAAPATAPPSPPAEPKVEPPMIDANYTPNAEVFRPPRISTRLGEHGKVLLSVTVGVSGSATLVTLLKSSGYPRLDQAATDGAKRLRFKPATRGGQAIEWTYELPVVYEKPE